MTAKKALGEKADDLFSDSEEWEDLNGLSDKLIVKTKDSEVLISESKENNLGVKTESSTKLSLNSEVMTEGLIDKHEESKVLSPESKDREIENKLSLTSEGTENSKVLTEEKHQQTGKLLRDTGSQEKSKPGPFRGTSLNKKAMEFAIEDAKRNPRIGIYSPISSAILKYKKKTIPEFSISNEARLLLEDSVARKYPKIAENLAFKKKSARSEAKKLDRDIFNEDMLNRATKEAEKNPKLTVWSPYAYAVFKYLRKTKPEFSMSEEASSLLDDAVARKYPKLLQALSER
jgi:hypothetical protein